MVTVIVVISIVGFLLVAMCMSDDDPADKE